MSRPTEVGAPRGSEPSLVRWSTCTSGGHYSDSYCGCRSCVTSPSSWPTPRALNPERFRPRRVCLRVTIGAKLTRSCVPLASRSGGNIDWRRRVKRRSRFRRASPRSRTIGPRSSKDRARRARTSLRLRRVSATSFVCDCAGGSLGKARIVGAGCSCVGPCGASYLLRCFQVGRSSELHLGGGGCDRFERWRQVGRLRRRGGSAAFILRAVPRPLPSPLPRGHG